MARRKKFFSSEEVKDRPGEPADLKEEIKASALKEEPKPEPVKKNRSSDYSDLPKFAKFKKGT